MKKITVLGAGKSAIYLLEYLAKLSKENNWKLQACDRDPAALAQLTAQLPAIETFALDVNDTNVLKSKIEGSDLVVSLLPPAMHPLVAEYCLEFGSNLTTASYVSKEMQQMHEAAASKGLVFLNEMGLDPGIDHMSAMKLLDEIREMGGEVTSFESYCGGLVQEEDCRDNPWKYKFSWNPMNVILAGQGGMSVYRKDGNQRYLPWHQLFAHSVKLEVPGCGIMDAYANRDSLGYETIYGLEKAHTILRGTLRRKWFCQAWQVLVQLGFTDNATVLHEGISSIAALTDALTGKSPSQTFTRWLSDQKIINISQKKWFDFLEMDSEAEIPMKNVTSAELLRYHLEQRWKLEENDRDEVIMFHRIGYELNGKAEMMESTLKVTGENRLHTAMAKTVGLPLAIGSELILKGELTQKGVCIPMHKELYSKVLPALKEHGIEFTEKSA